MEDNQYFKSVEFPELEEKKEVKTPVVDPIKGVEWDSIIMELRRMLSAIESGESNIVKFAINLGNSPVSKAISSLSEDPSVHNLKRVLVTAQQDVNSRFRRECLMVMKGNNKLNEFIKENNLE